MVKTLEIKSFKSIKHLKLDCKRVNVFIGKPNAGKSNLLESVGVFSLPFGSLGNIYTIREFIRLENMADLFYDHDLSESVEVKTDHAAFQIRFDNRVFKGDAREEGNNANSVGFEIYDNGKIGNTSGELNLPFRFYRFVTLGKFSRQELDCLLPPKGENLCQILLTRKDLRKFVAGLLREYELKVVLKEFENKIELQKKLRTSFFRLLTRCSPILCSA